MSFISTLALAMGSSWVSGINLYAGVATLGLLGRFAHLNLPGELGFVTNWWVIGVAAGLYVVEFFADKVPLIDSAWKRLRSSSSEGSSNDLVPAGTIQSWPEA